VGIFSPVEILIETPTVCGFSATVANMRGPFKSIADIKCETIAQPVAFSHTAIIAGTIAFITVIA
jgi:hypothetical protein